MQDHTNHQDIRIGTMAGKQAKTAEYIKSLIPYGFETFEINFWQKIDPDVNLKKLAKEVNAVLEGTGATITSLAMFGNPLDPHAGNHKETLAGWKACIDNAHLFGCDLVCGFAGRIIDKPIPESIPAFKKVFGDLAKRAADKGVRIAFENCDMGGTWRKGDWNIAWTPDCWEMMFDAVPAENLGLEWEPCHQLVKLIDPMPQLRKWVPKIFQLHGKDATVMWDVVRSQGIYGPQPFAFHRSPGFGDTNWVDVISELRRHNFKGSIAIEGWHDPVYRADLELTGQVHALNYLKACRGGEFLPNVPLI